MPTSDVVPELKEILGAMIFATNRALTVNEMRKCLREVAENFGGETSAFAGATNKDIRSALDTLASDISQARCGFLLAEVAQGFTLQSNVACGKWLRHLLSGSKPARLSRPALETLAIVACRQPLSRAEIEAVRGVSIDHVLKTLMELQLVRIVSRSELPGRPFLYGTTLTFLEHFGLRNLDELQGMNQMLRSGPQAEKQESSAATGPPPAITPAHDVEPAPDTDASQTPETEDTRLLDIKPMPDAAAARGFGPESSGSEATEQAETKPVPDAAATQDPGPAGSGLEATDPQDVVRVHGADAAQELSTEEAEDMTDEQG